MQVDFSMVAEEPSFPKPDAATLERYVVYVGFDSQAAEVAEKPKSRQAKPKPVAAAPRPAAPASAAQAAPAAMAPRPSQSANNAPIYGTPQQPAPRAAAPPATHNTTGQWIGTQPPSTGGFMTPTQ
jgi:hypothetical protein